MREILFRGKSLRTGEWRYGSFVEKYHSYKLQKEISAIFWNDGRRTLRSLIDIETVGQYTGQNDIDGKKIFEGDIITHYQDDENEVYWANDFGGWHFSNSHASALPLEPYTANISKDATPIRVIGNIHNKEQNEKK